MNVWSDENKILYHSPNLIPEEFKALLSPGTVFLLQAMFISSKMNSPLAPDSFAERRSTSNMCTSVPPVTTL